MSINPLHEDPDRVLGSTTGKLAGNCQHCAWLRAEYEDCWRQFIGRMDEFDLNASDEDLQQWLLISQQASDLCDAALLLLNRHLDLAHGSLPEIRRSLPAC